MTPLEATCVDAFDFRYPGVGRVAFGAGGLCAQVPAQLKEWGAERVVVVASRSLAGTPEVRQLLSALRPAGVDPLLFSRGMQHGPLPVAAELVQAGVAHAATTLVAIGGSSVSDTAKAANLLATFGGVEAVGSTDALRPRIDAAVPLAWRLVAVPTTLSGGEFTPVVGITDPASGRKAVLRHPGLCAAAIVLDPELQRHTPDRLWAASGFKLLDHAVERLLARNHRPLIDAQSVFGAGLVLAGLVGCVGGAPAAAQARARMLQALWVIQSSHGNVGTGLSHALTHQLGAALGLDHGCGSAICLPPTLRFLAETGRLEPARLDLLASAFGVARGAAALEGVLHALEALRTALGLPRTLREAGVPSIDALRIAQATVADPTIDAAPGRPIAPAELVPLLERLAGSVRDASFVS